MNQILHNKLIILFMNHFIIFLYTNQIKWQNHYNKHINHFKILNFNKVFYNFIIMKI